MAQFGRPVSDALVGNWEDEGGATVDLWQSVDEVTPNDSDYVRSDANPANSPVVFKISDLVNPPAGTFGNFRIRARKQPTSASQMNISFELREGYVNESNLGTRIGFTILQPNIGSNFTTYSGTFAANDVGDWTNLFVRMFANQL